MWKHLNQHPPSPPLVGEHVRCTTHKYIILPDTIIMVHLLMPLTLNRSSLQQGGLRTSFTSQGNTRRVFFLPAHHSYCSVASTDLSLCQHVHHLNHASAGNNFAVFWPLSVVELFDLKASNQCSITLGDEINYNVTQWLLATSMYIA